MDTSILTHVIQIPSYSGMENKVQEFVMQFCNIHGFANLILNLRIKKSLPSW